MDTNKYRAQHRYTQGKGALSDEALAEVLGKFNNPAVRVCIGINNDGNPCNKKFKSAGAFNRKCKSCKQREDMSRGNDRCCNPVMHRDPTLRTRRFAEYTY